MTGVFGYVNFDDIPLSSSGEDESDFECSEMSQDEEIENEGRAWRIENNDPMTPLISRHQLECLINDNNDGSTIDSDLESSSISSKTPLRIVMKTPYTPLCVRPPGWFEAVHGVYSPAMNRHFDTLKSVPLDKNTSKTLPNEKGQFDSHLHPRQSTPRPVNKLASLVHLSRTIISPVLSSRASNFPPPPLQRHDTKSIDGIIIAPTHLLPSLASNPGGAKEELSAIHPKSHLNHGVTSSIDFQASTATTKWVRPQAINKCTDPINHSSLVSEPPKIMTTTRHHFGIDSCQEIRTPKRPKNTENCLPIRSPLLDITIRASNSNGFGNSLTQSQGGITDSSICTIEDLSYFDSFSNCSEVNASIQTIDSFASLLATPLSACSFHSFRSPKASALERLASQVDGLKKSIKQSRNIIYDH